MGPKSQVGDVGTKFGAEVAVEQIRHKFGKFRIKLERLCIP